MFALTIVLLLIGFLAIPTNNQGARWAIAVFVSLYIQVNMSPGYSYRHAVV